MTKEAHMEETAQKAQDWCDPETKNSSEALGKPQLEEHKEVEVSV